MSFPASRVISNDRIAIKHKSISMNLINIETKNDGNHNNDCPLFDAKTAPLEIESYSKYTSSSSNKDDFHSSNRSYDTTTRKPSISHKQSKETPIGKYSLASSYESTNSISSMNSLSTSPSKSTLNVSMISGRSESSNKDKPLLTKNVDISSTVADDCADINFSSILPAYTPKETYRRSSESSVSGQSSSSIRLTKRQPPLVSLPNNTNTVNNTIVSSPIQLTDTWDEAIASPQPVPLVSQINYNSSRDSLMSITNSSHLKATDSNESALSDSGSFLNTYLYLGALPSQSSEPASTDPVLSAKSAINDDDDDDTLVSKPNLQPDVAVASRQTSATTVLLNKEESAFGLGSVSTPNNHLPTRSQLESRKSKAVSSRSENESENDSRSDESDEDEEICTARAVMTPFSAKFTASFSIQSQSPSASIKTDYRKTINGTSMPTSKTVPIQRLMTPVVVAARRNAPLTEADQPPFTRSRLNSQRRNSVDSPTSREFVKLPTRPCSIASPLPLSPSELKHLAQMGDDDADDVNSTSTTPAAKKDSNNNNNNNHSCARSSVEVEVDIQLIRAITPETNSISTSAASQRLSATSSDTQTKTQRFCTPVMPTDFLTDKTAPVKPFDLSNLKTASSTLARAHRPKSNSVSSIVIQDTLKNKNNLNCLASKSSSEHVISRRGSLPSDMNNIKLATKTELDDDDALPPLPGSNRSSVSSCLSVLPPPVKSKSPLRKSLSQSTAQDAANSLGFASDAPTKPRTGSVDFGGRTSLTRSVVDESSQGARVPTSTALPTRTGSTPPISAVKHSHTRKGSNQSSLLNNGVSPRTSISSRRSSVASFSSRTSVTNKSSGNQLDSLEAFIRSQFGLNQPDKPLMHNQQQQSMSDVSIHPPSLPNNVPAVPPKNITTSSNTKPSPSSSYKVKHHTHSDVPPPVSTTKDERLSKEKSLPVTPTSGSSPHLTALISTSVSKMSSSSSSSSSFNSSNCSDYNTNTKINNNNQQHSAAGLASSTSMPVSKSNCSGNSNSTSYSLSRAPPPPIVAMPMRLPRDQFIVKLVIDHDHRIALCVSSNAGYEAFYLLALRKAVRAGFAESDVRERLLVLSVEGRLTRITDEHGFRLMEKVFRHQTTQQPTVHWV